MYHVAFYLVQANREQFFKLCSHMQYRLFLPPFYPMLSAHDFRYQALLISREYSKTSNSGPSEIGTVYNRPLYKGHCLKSQIFTLPIVSILLQPPRRGQPLYKGQNMWIYIVPNVSLVRRFHCTLKKAGYGWGLGMRLRKHIILHLDTCTHVIAIRHAKCKRLAMLIGHRINHWHR